MVLSELENLRGAVNFLTSSLFHCRRAIQRGFSKKAWNGYFGT